MAENYRPFVVRRTTGGDVLREDDPTAWLASLRWGARVVKPEEVEDVRLLTRPYFYDGAIITVQVPQEVDWTQAVLVRGGFGAPTTPQDGIAIWYSDDKPTGEDDQGNPNHLSQEVLDRPLTSPNWYYYTLFLWIGGQWIRAYQGEVLVPMDHGWGDLMFASIPPFYQETDDQQAADGRNGPLRVFTSIMGYDLDYTQCWVDGIVWLNIVDKAPMKLVTHLGDNWGFPYEHVLGANRTRSVLEQLDDLNGLRGTELGLRRLISAASDYRCDVAQGFNDLLAVDDGDFDGRGGIPNIDPTTLPPEEEMRWGIGHWQPLTHPDYLALITDPIDDTTPEAATDTPAILAKNTVPGPGNVLTPPGGRGAMVVNGPGPQTVVVCGNISGDPGGVVTRSVYLPAPGVITSGVPVKAGGLYEVSAHTLRTGWGTAAEQPPVGRVLVGAIWWTIDGQPISADTGPVIPTNDDDVTWKRSGHQAFAPSVENGNAADAWYATPFVWWQSAGTWAGAWTDPLSPPTYGRYLAMVSFGRVKIEGEDVAPVPPDVYLTLGVDDKLLAGPESFLGEPGST